MTSVYNCNVISLEKISTERGALTSVSNQKSIPFQVRRVYYLYDVPSGAVRGGHAHRELKQLIVAASGSFDVVLDDGEIRRHFSLNRPDIGLLVFPGIWRELENFSAGSVCLVLASELYSESDYLRDYSDFLLYRKVKGT